MTQNSAPAGLPAPRQQSRRIDAALLLGLLLVLPALALAVLFKLVPLLRTLVLSLYETRGFSDPTFAWFRNYELMLRDPAFWGAFRNAALVFATLPVWVVLPLLLALLIFQRTPGWKVFRAAYFLPYMIAPVVVGIMFRQILAPDGPLNALLIGIGLAPLAIEWLNGPASALFSLTGVALWAFFGLGVLTYSPGTPPDEVIEAPSRRRRVRTAGADRGAAAPAGDRLLDGAVHLEHADLDVPADLRADARRAGLGDHAARIPRLHHHLRVSRPRPRRRHRHGAVRLRGPGFGPGGAPHVCRGEGRPMSTGAAAPARPAAAGHGALARPIVRWALTVVLAVVAVVALYPLLFTFVNSLKTRSDFAGNALGLPAAVTLENYTQTFARMNVPQLLFNTIVTTAGGLVLSTVAALFVAYAVTKLRIRGGNLIFLFIISMLVIPSQVVIYPLYETILNLGLGGTYQGLILSYAAFGLPISTYMLVAFFRAIPDELIAAARIDGAGGLRILFQLLLPISTPAIAAISILNFVWMWNDFCCRW